MRLALSASIAALAAMLLVGGCGYHFGASGTNLPASAQTIYVKRFDNRTRKTGVNDEFMVYLKDEIASHKRLTLVDSPSDADLELTGTVIQNLAVPNAFNLVATAPATVGRQRRPVQVRRN